MEKQTLQLSISLCHTGAAVNIDNCFMSTLCAVHLQSKPMYFRELNENFVYFCSGGGGGVLDVLSIIMSIRQMS